MQITMMTRGGTQNVVVGVLLLVLLVATSVVAMATGGASSSAQVEDEGPASSSINDDGAQQRKLNKKTPDDYLVEGLDEIEPAYGEFEGNMYAGLVPIRNGDRFGETMFWLFEPSTQSVNDTLVVWLNGGPGCSSFNCGVMMEHSPVTQPLRSAGYCCLSSKPKLGVNKHAWTRATTMLYVEHPIGTGTCK